jgi:hypothetical protein
MRRTGSGTFAGKIEVASMGTVMITVRGMAQPCWRCHASSGAVVALHPADDLRFEAACWHDDRPVLALAKELLAAAGEHVVAGQITERFSRTVGDRYLSNGCHRCSALFGAFFLGEEVLAVAAEGGTLDAFRPLASQAVDAARWAALVAARTSVIG